MKISKVEYIYNVWLSEIRFAPGGQLLVSKQANSDELRIWDFCLYICYMYIRMSFVL